MGQRLEKNPFDYKGSQTIREFHRESDDEIVMRRDNQEADLGTFKLPFRDISNKDLTCNLTKIDKEKIISHGNHTIKEAKSSFLVPILCKKKVSRKKKQKKFKGVIELRNIAALNMKYYDAKNIHIPVMCAEYAEEIHKDMMMKEATVFDAV